MVIVVNVIIIYCRQVRIQKKVVEAETVVVMNHVGVVVVVVAEEVVGVVKVVGVVEEVEEGLAKDPAAATRNLRESMSKMRTHFLRYK